MGGITAEYAAFPNGLSTSSASWHLAACGARRMTESAALLVDEVLPRVPLRQWVLSVPFALRFLFATEPAAMGRVLGIVYRAIATHLARKAGLTHATARIGAVTLIQRFGSALNLNMPAWTADCSSGACRRRPGRTCAAEGRAEYGWRHRRQW